MGNSSRKCLQETKTELPAIMSSTYTGDDIVNMIKTEVAKVASNVPMDTITSLIQRELSKLSVSVNVAPVETAVAASATVAALVEQQT